MFENPHIIHEIARQRHKELLAEAEHIHRMKASSDIVMKKNRRLGKIILPIADLLIAIGVGLNKRFVGTREETKDTVSNGSEP